MDKNAKIAKVSLHQFNEGMRVGLKRYSKINEHYSKLKLQPAFPRVKKKTTVKLGTYHETTIETVRLTSQK